MTNKEFFKEQIWELACDDERIAVDRRTNKPCRCAEMKCEDCALECHEISHCEALNKWGNAEHVEPYSFKKDELVEVSLDGTDWYIRHFSHIDENGFNGRFLVFNYGRNSETEERTSSWRYCRKYGTLGGLAEGEKIRKEAIRKFAEWVDENYETEHYIPNLVEFYEKEKKNEL